ncbi:DUF2461 domain-containing protein [Microbacterium capsulatum]|uniref:DUF2461 domain-containing protein n=1 Tax=Microbacterium capsulatum TaxID=3041921 RepID=A0ABU0XDX9_9MICO|nr:DUF2461 domain-containing protein [Microbacterium sp. ASV81]MDQ4212823.1 DUF2461 domain-containing protein [Microbacterium sp. ASV81]
MASTFTGWSPAAADFYRGLEADNSKAYWTEHRPVYDDEVLAPMQALLADLADEFGEGKIFRPNRDIRFSTDKSPYKTSISAMLGQGYVEFSARGIGVGAGCHMMAPDQLARMRSAVADDTTGPELEGILATLTDGGIDVIAHERLATAPRGFPKDHPRADLLRNKDLAAWKQWPATETWLHTAEAESRIVDVLRASRPLVDWLDENVGATTLERRR